MRSYLVILFLAISFSGISQGKVRTILNIDCEDAEKYRFDSIIIENKTYAYNIFKVEGNIKLDTASNFGKCWALLKNFTTISPEVKRKIAKQLFSRYAFLRINFIEDCEVRRLIYQATYPTEAEKKKIGNGIVEYYFKDVL